jgi:hypothetical protein
MMMTTTTDSPDPLWTARLDHLKILLTLLKAIHSSRWMVCRIEPHGLRCSTYGEHESMAAVAHAYLQDKLWQSYRFQNGKEHEEEGLVFKLDLNALTECLQMWFTMHMERGPNSLLPIRLTYSGSELMIMLEEGGMATMARFKVFEVDRPLPQLDFRSHEITSRLILKVGT